jgi:hypothetical protein
MQLTDEDKNWIATVIDTALRQSETGLMERVAGRIDAAEVRTTESTAHTLEASETRLLAAFHGWASPLERNSNAIARLEKAS